MPTAKDIITQEIQKELPKGELPFTVFYWKSKGVRCRPLVYRGKYKMSKDNKRDPSSTDKVTTHFVVLSFEGVIIYAIEIMVYDMPRGQQTIFVSKADTTGHYSMNSNSEGITRPRLSYAKVTSAIFRGLLRCYIDPLRPVRICLFARSEKQYLFPSSSECSSKHILSGSQLLRWWIKVIGETLKLPDLVQEIGRARLQIPGSNPSRISTYFPRNSSGGLTINWEPGDVFWPDDNPILPAVNCIPRFKDDPLTRFLDFLVMDNATKIDRDRFWTALEAQQEFRLSVEVGIIGVEFKLNPSSSIYSPTSNDNSIPALSTRNFNNLREFVSTLDYSIVEMNQEAVKTLVRRNPSLEIFGTNEGQVKEVRNTPTVNVLNNCIVRKKKRKTDDGATSTPLMDSSQTNSHVSSEPVVNTLATNLVRRKPKSEPKASVNNP